MNKLPILNYHGIETSEDQYSWLESEKVYVLLREVFERQLTRLSGEGFKTLSLGELEEWLEGKNLCEKPVMLTFDDGHISHLKHVVPVLKEKNFKAIFFIPVSLIGQAQHMNWSQLKELIQEGFEVGSHGFRHIPLSNLTHHELWKELQKSKATLEDRLGVPVKSFSVPRGFYQLRIREFAMELGYRFVFTSRFDLNLRGQDPWRLNRIAAKKTLSFNDFSKFIYGQLGHKRVVERFKEGARRFLKPSIYDTFADWKRLVMQKSEG